MHLKGLNSYPIDLIELKIITMKKHVSLIVFLTSTFIMFGQQLTFEKNINGKARILSQSLNEAKDSLLLELKDKQIERVNIISENYSESISVNNSKTQIDLKKLPIGKFIVLAKVEQKWITMYLQKNGEHITSSKPLKSNIVKTNYLIANQNMNLAIKKEKFVYCWVVLEKNSNFGSSKSMKLEYIDNVAHMIKKNKLELQSHTGKANTLKIYPVYDKSQFMTNQLRNPDYYKTVEQSEFFSTTPYYSSSQHNNISTSP